MPAKHNNTTTLNAHITFRKIALQSLALWITIIAGIASMGADSMDIPAVRTVKPGMWEDTGIWERWSGEGWTPLLPGQFPGCRSLKKVHVFIEHPTLLRYGVTIHVAAVTAIDYKNLLVDGHLIADIQPEYIDSAYDAATPVVTGEPIAQAGIRLGGAFPNPVSQEHGSITAISFTIDNDRTYSWVNLSLHDESGATVRALERYENIGPGRYTLSVDVSDLSSGNYYFIMEAPGVRSSKKLIVIK